MNPPVNVIHMADRSMEIKSIWSAASETCVLCCHEQVAVLLDEHDWLQCAGCMQLSAQVMEVYVEGVTFNAALSVARAHVVRAPGPEFIDMVES